MATYTSLINSTLRKLRETAVAGPTSSDYAALIGQFVNEAKREVEDAWNWTALRTTIQVVTADGTQQYAITGAGKRFRLQNPQRSVYDVTNTHRLLPQSAVWLKESLLINTNRQQPSYYYFEGFDGNEDPYVNFYAIPDGAYTINFDLIVPQDDFSTGSEILSVPSNPVILGAYTRALYERGEDNGRTSDGAIAEYKAALSDAIAIDESLTLGETTWYA